MQNLEGLTVWKALGKSDMPPSALISPNESVMVYEVSSGLASLVKVMLCQPS